MRPTRATIDLAALKHNYRLAQRLGGGKALAVVKADAYGHGAVRCAQSLEPEADGFAVACIEEALELREAGVCAPILLLEGFFEPAELDLIDRHALWCAVHADWQLDAIERSRPRRPLVVWLLLDSGMHRLGFPASDYPARLHRAKDMPQIGKVVSMTHFARADEPGCPRTGEQHSVFERATAGAGLSSSLCNSAALLGWTGIRGEWGRPGLMLYGADPLGAPRTTRTELRPVMTLESSIIAVREIAAGEPVGYGGRFVAARPTRIGVVAAGYGDGYPQFAPDGTAVAIAGEPGRLAGRVSMDMLTVDLTDHPKAGLGTRVELWGARVPVTELAAGVGSTAYALLCGLKRVPRRYVDG